MKLGFGLMRLPIVGEEYSEIDLPRLCQMADEFIAAGGTYFDTAYVYHGGKSEVFFREAVVKRYPRESFTIADKFPVFNIKSADELEPIFAQQLERCGVEYIDYYLLHALNAERYDFCKRIGAFEWLDRLKAEGRVRHIGFSFHDSPEVLEKILSEQPQLEFVQLQINYLDWEDVGICSRECWEIAVRHNQQIVIMEPIKGGALANLPEEAQALFAGLDANASAASWAVRYAASLENVFMVLSGMSNEEQMRDNLSYMSDFVPFEEKEYAAVMQAAQIIRKSVAIGCTGCRYCVDDCPQQIAIADYFALYNRIKQYGDHSTRERYAELAETHGRASDCIGCGLCEGHCPQHLPIREWLVKVAETFEKKDD